jgi:F-type H+-transporting ATPase subunit a
MAAGHDDPFHHVRDFPYFEFPGGRRVELPELFLPSPSKMLHNASQWYEGYQGDTRQLLDFFGDTFNKSSMGLQLTKFMVLQLVAAVLTFLIFVTLARKVRTGAPVRGRWWNFWEMLAVYIRDHVVRPTIGDPHHHHEDANHALHADFVAGGEDIHYAHAHEPAVPERRFGVNLVHPADRYLPFIWSCFFYVLFCNLLGAIPWMGSPTGEINVTAVLALVAFGAVVFSGTQQFGAAGFWKNLAPSMDMPGALKPIMLAIIWPIEFIGLLIKHGVLAVRLFANIMAGHTVIAVILSFIAVAANSWLFYLVTPASILGQVAIGLLELFVAFLQAYIFAFLATLFIATAVHHH